MFEHKNIFDPGDEDLLKQRLALVDDGIGVVRANRMYWHVRTLIETRVADDIDVEFDTEQLHAVTGAVLLLYRRHFTIDDESNHLAQLMEWLEATDSVLVYAFCVAYDYVDGETVESVRREYSPIER